MLFISAVNIFSVLVLGSTLTGLVLATGPRTQCVGMGFTSINLVPLGANSAPFFFFHTVKYNSP